MALAVKLTHLEYVSQWLSVVRRLWHENTHCILYMLGNSIVWWTLMWFCHNSHFTLIWLSSMYDTIRRPCTILTREKQVDYHLAEATLFLLLFAGSGYAYSSGWSCYRVQRFCNCHKCFVANCSFIICVAWWPAKRQNVLHSPIWHFLM